MHQQVQGIQRAFQFSTTGYCIRGKQCNLIEVRNYKSYLSSKVSKSELAKPDPKPNPNYSSMFLSQLYEKFKIGIF